MFLQSKRWNVFNNYDKIQLQQLAIATRVVRVAGLAVESNWLRAKNMKTAN